MSQKVLWGMQSDLYTIGFIDMKHSTCQYDKTGEIRILRKHRKGCV